MYIDVMHTSGRSIVAAAVRPPSKVSSVIPELSDAAPSLRIVLGESESSQQQQRVGRRGPLRAIQASPVGALGGQEPVSPSRIRHVGPLGCNRFGGRAEQILKRLPSNGDVSIEQPLDGRRTGGLFSDRRQVTEFRAGPET